MGEWEKWALGKWRNRGESWERARDSTSSFLMLKITGVSKIELFGMPIRYFVKPASYQHLRLESLLMTTRAITSLPYLQPQAMHIMAPEPSYGNTLPAPASDPTIVLPTAILLCSNRLLSKLATCIREPEICDKVYKTT